MNDQHVMHGVTVSWPVTGLRHCCMRCVNISRGGADKLRRSRVYDYSFTMRVSVLGLHFIFRVLKTERRD